MAYFLPFLVALLGCFGMQAIALQLTGGKTVKSESNFFSSLARVQTGIRGNPQIMLLGSSITGRLPDRHQGFAGVANLGCDGGSAMDTLRAMDQGLIPAAPLLVIEGNTLYRAVSVSETEISRAIASPWFRVGQAVPLFGATARPSAFAYSFLLGSRIGEAQGPSAEPLPVASKPHLLATRPQLPSPERTLANEAIEIVHRLNRRDIKVIVVVLPKGLPDDSLSLDLAKAVASGTESQFWDLMDNLPDNSFQLTDGVHMSPHSAAATVQAILREVPSH